MLGAGFWGAEADQTMVNMPCGEIIDYRQDFLFRFIGILQLPTHEIAEYERLPPGATPQEREEKLVGLKLDALCIARAENDLVAFYSKHKYPPKSDGVIAPVIRFIQSDPFQKEEKQLPLTQHDIERADFTQTKAIFDHYAKIPLPSQQQMNEYIDEAVYGGNLPRMRN